MQSYLRDPFYVAWLWLCTIAPKGVNQRHDPLCFWSDSGVDPIALLNELNAIAALSWYAI